VVQHNLQSRLDAAREVRRRAAAPTAAAEPVPTPDSGEDPGSHVIDLRTLREMRQAALRAQPGEDGDTGEERPRPWKASPRASTALLLQRQAALRGEAVPTTNPAQEPCPNCGGSVRLDLYDLVESVAHLSCLDCGFLFTARSPNA
jgi:hypothetical protein